MIVRSVRSLTIERAVLYGCKRTDNTRYIKSAQSCSRDTESECVTAEAVYIVSEHNKASVVSAVVIVSPTFSST